VTDEQRTAARRRGIHDWEALRRATWLELFFDLVFVVAVARLAIQLRVDHSVPGLLGYAGLFVAVWWLWISFSYFADLFDDDGPLQRLAQLVAMLGAAVLAVTLGDGIAADSGRFAGTFGALFALLAGMYAVAARAEPRAAELCHWYVAGSAIGSALWFLSLAVPVPGRYLVWGLALTANALISGPIAYARMRNPPHQRSHMPERFGLFVIVVLGEAVLSVVNGIETTHWNPGAVVVAVSGFVIACCMWWVYFDAFDEGAIDRAIEGGRRAQVASFLYGYGHLLIYASIAAAGVGVQLAAEAAAKHAAGGVALLGGAQVALIVAFVVVSSPFGLRGHSPIIAVKAALAGLALIVAVAVRAPVAGAALCALGWVGLVGAEIVMRSRPGSARPGNSVVPPA
jgi:low temperature requirement protein LtrA